MSSASILWHGGPFDRNTVTEVFKNSVHKYTVINSDTLLNDVFTTDLLTVTGIDVIALAHKLEKTDKIQKNTEFTIVVTNTKLSCTKRIYTHKKLSIVSTYGLQNDESDAKRIALLIYSALVCMSNTLSDCDTKLHCALHPSKYVNWLPTDISPECKCNLTNHGAIESLELNKIFASEAHNGNLVIIVHGILTFAEWAPSVEAKFREYNFLTSTHYFGLFSLFGVLLSPIFGYFLYKRFYSIYQHESGIREDIKISIVAHSYGTRIVANALKRYKKIKLDKVILVNGCVRRKFKWATLFKREQVDRVLNECSGDDWVPILADKTILGCGDSGYTFFDIHSKEVINLLYDKENHTSLLNPVHCEHIWIPFIYKGHEWQPDSHHNRNWLKHFSWLPGWFSKSLIYGYLIYYFLIES